MSKVLVNPDIHGRTFWKKCINEVDNYDKIIFLGDYVDPYDFEPYSVEDAIANFEEIIDFAKANKDKVVLLAGNHDCPYISETYYYFDRHHCRHSERFHKDIAQLFDDNRDLFKVAYEYQGILFTHAGVTDGWYSEISDDVDNIVDILNNLLTTEEGLRRLYEISKYRGGWDAYGSCVWADVHEMMSDEEQRQYNDSKLTMKQVFGHTLQAFYDRNGGIVYGEPIEGETFKMLDNCKTYVLDCGNFTATPF